MDHGEPSVHFSTANGSTMSRIEELKEKIDSKTLNLVLLTIVSMGMYSLLWVYRANQIISDVTKTRIVDYTYFVWISVLLGLGGTLSTSVEDHSLVLIGGLISLSGSVMYIVWAFKARKVLTEYALTEHHIYLRMNSFYTLIFSSFYINYCINDLPEEKRRQDIYRSDPPSPPPGSSRGYKARPAPTLHK